MDFKNLLAACSVIFALATVGCGGKIAGSNNDEDYFLGDPLKSLASMSTPDEGDSQIAVLFDKTVRRIHQFDVVGMKHIRSFEVRNPNDDHNVLYGNGGNYIIDLSYKNLSIFNKNNQAVHQPIKLPGKPLSAKFLPSKGLLVVYDDTMSVGMLKLSAEGEVLKSWMGPPIVARGSSISAGDLNTEGQLILALNNGSMVVVDIEKCMDEQAWGNLDPFATGLGDIKWLAPLPTTPKQVLIRSSQKISLFDIDSKSVISNYDLPGNVIKVSKFNDPHVIVQNGSKIEIVYAQGSQVLNRTFIPRFKDSEVYSLLSTQLDLAKDSWTFVDSKESVSYFWNDLNGTQKQRRVVRNRFSDFQSIYNMPIANDSQVELATGFVFALFPSELGYAVRYDLATESTTDLKFFNLKYFPVD